MLPPQSLDLLTAYVDGELSPRQRRAVERLLGRSAEARALLNRLQTDAAQLRRLPPAPAPADLASPVLGAIARRPLRPARQPAGRQPAQFPVWAGYAAAAAVLLIVAAATFFDYSTAEPSLPDTGPVPRQRAKAEDRLPMPRPVDELVRGSA